MPYPCTFFAALLIDDVDPIRLAAPASGDPPSPEAKDCLDNPRGGPPETEAKRERGDEGPTHKEGFPNPRLCPQL